MQQRQPTPLRKEEFQLASLAGKRIGVDGNWFVAHLRSNLKSEDQYWALGGPVTPAIPRIVERFVKRFDEIGATPIFVFDGLYTRRQSHPAILLHQMDHKSDQPSFDLPSHIRDHEPLDEDAVMYLVRILVGMRLMTITAPYLATAQLAYFASDRNGEPFVHDVMGTTDCLCYSTIKRVIMEIGKFLDDPKAILTAYSVNQPHCTNEDVLRYLLEPNRINKSIHWSWAIGMTAPQDQQFVKQTIDHCPIFTTDGEVMPYLKAVHGAPGLADMAAFYFKDLGAEFPLLYFLLSANIVSSQLLNVVATEKFIDDPPLVKSQQYDITLERIIPLRTQIVFQLIQELQRYLVGLTRTTNLHWDRPSEGQTLPIQRPPKILLDEWENIDPSPPVPYNFHNVLAYHMNARAPPEDSEDAPPLVTYTSSEQALGAILLKALDLLGYFTHAAHGGQDAEESSMSVFAMALNTCTKFGSEAVLLIELTRTRSLHDGPLGVAVHPNLAPEPLAPGVRYAARIMSLLQLNTEKAHDGRRYSIDLLAFNEIARAFQRNLASADGGNRRYAGAQPHRQFPPRGNARLRRTSALRDAADDPRRCDRRVHAYGSALQARADDGHRAPRAPVPRVPARGGHADAAPPDGDLLAGVRAGHPEAARGRRGRAGLPATGCRHAVRRQRPHGGRLRWHRAAPAHQPEQRLSPPPTDGLHLRPCRCENGESERDHD
jgi:hypothetical protein